MKKTLKFTLIVLGIAIAGGLIYWQGIRKGFIKSNIQKAILKGTDSLYYIRYDSSKIDEVNGSAIFYHVKLQSDSLQQQLATFDTASSNSIFNITVEKVSVEGVDIPGLVSNTNVQAKKLELIKPEIYLIQAKGENAKQIKIDTTALYKKILGKFNSISADEIIIEDGTFSVFTGSGEANTVLKNIDIHLRNFSVDSRKDYNNIISYFVKDVDLKVEQATIRSGNGIMNLSRLVYNAPQKFVELENFIQSDSTTKPVVNVNKVRIAGISTDAFIVQQKIKADSLTTASGYVRLVRKKTQRKTDINETIELDNTVFNEAQVDNIILGKTKIEIFDNQRSAAPPITINNVEFKASGIQKLQSGIPVKNLISQSSWQLSGDGFSFLTNNKIYKISVGDFSVDNRKSLAKLNYINFKPQLTEQEYVRTLRFQHDLYDMQFNNISLSGFDIKRLIESGEIIAQQLQLEPELAVFNDRTVTPSTASKVGNYPQQMLQKLNIPVYVGNLIVKNGRVHYKERGAVSKQSGVVKFEKINATVSNLTNMPEFIGRQPNLLLKAKCSFMGITPLSTTWTLPLNSSKGNFEVKGNIGAFHAPALNEIIEPLGMASIRSGEVKSLAFNLTGDDLQARGPVILKYTDLQIDMLKKEENELNKKGLMSVLANLLMKNSNPRNGKLKEADAAFERIQTKSFFNLIWKTIFDGVKKTAQKI